MTLCLSSFALLPFPQSFSLHRLLLAVVFLLGFCFPQGRQPAQKLKMLSGLRAMLLLDLRAVPTPMWSSPAVPMATIHIALNMPSEAAEEGAEPVHSNSQKLKESGGGWQGLAPEIV